MLPLTNDKIIKLGENLNTSNNEKILATHAGLALGLKFILNINSVDFLRRDMETKMILEDLLYAINEINIIDVKLVKTFIDKLVRLEDSFLNIEKMVSALKPNPKALDIFGAGEIFSRDELQAIENNNIDYYTTFKLIIDLKDILLKEIGR